MSPGIKCRFALAIISKKNELFDPEKISGERSESAVLPGYAVLYFSFLLSSQIQRFRLVSYDLGFLDHEGRFLQKDAEMIG